MRKIALFGGLLLLGLTAARPLQLSAAEPVVGRPPVTARAWNEEGTRQAQQGEYQGALHAFTRAIQLSPKSSDLYVNRGLVHVRTKAWELAEAEFTLAISINHEDTRAFLQRAIVRAESNRNQDAFRDASRAARMEPDNAQTVFLRHLLCSRTGRHDLGHTAGRTYLGIRGWDDPWAPFVALLNYVALRRAGETVAAADVLAEAAAMLPAQDWPYAVVIFLRGNLTAESLLQLAGDNERATLARYYIGMADWLAGDVAKAKAQFEWVASEGNVAFLQHRLAQDHLQELAANIAPAPASKE